jgi:hypothetical protein
MATQPDEIGSLESILGLLLSLKISGSEYQAFSSVVLIVSPPHPQANVSPPGSNFGGWGQSLVGEGAGPITTGEKAWYSRYRMIHKVITYVEYRAVSGIFHSIDPPPPPTPLRECVLPPHQSRIGVHTRQEVRGWGVNIWKTPVPRGLL